MLTSVIGTLFKQSINNNFYIENHVYNFTCI